MAGSYPDVPGYKFAYDKDGTTVVFHGTTPAIPNATQLASINNDDIASNWNFTMTGQRRLCFIYPENRSLSGLFINFTRAQNVNIEYSNDSTTGLDGTWTTVTNTFPIILEQSDRLLLRTGIVSLSVPSHRVLRINIPLGSSAGNNNFVMFNLHLYGSIQPTESPNRLRIVDMSSTSTTSNGVTVTGADITAQLDFGNIPQRSNVTRQIKVTNNSSTQTANNITVSLDAPYDASPSLIGQFQLSTDNIAFANAVNIGSLGPGVSSGTLYIRDTIASNAQLSVWSARITASAVSWS